MKALCATLPTCVGAHFHALVGVDLGSRVVFKILGPFAGIGNITAPAI